MGRFILRRALWTAVVLFIVSIITFFMMHSIPGGPFDSEKLNSRVAEAMARAYNLDAPVYIQYLDYINKILIPRVAPVSQDRDEDYLVSIPLGDEQALQWMNFGPSYKSGRSVNDIFRENLPVSFQLGVAALGVALAIGLPSGIIAALNRNNVWDYTAMGLALVGVSVSVIISAPLLKYVFAVRLQWLPDHGWGGPEHMILPALALGFFNSAIIARLTRASLLQVLNEDYIRTARAKGLSEWGVVMLHALKNALIPVVTVLGPMFAALTTGTFVVEQIFAIPGLGKYFITSITNRDYAVIMGTVLLYAFFLVFSNTLVDIVYAMIDPRIRYD
jgi:oligopeptide transport system permease protein